VYWSQVGYGEAGVEIIAENMASGTGLDPMVPGKKVVAIFGFCDIRLFNDITEVLQVNHHAHCPPLSPPLFVLKRRVACGLSIPTKAGSWRCNCHKPRAKLELTASPRIACFSPCESTVVVAPDNPEHAQIFPQRRLTGGGHGGAGGVQEGVMEFVNTIAKIVHMEVHLHDGSANKNIGNAFLLVWKFPPEVQIRDIFEALVAGAPAVRAIPLSAATEHRTGSEAPSQS